MGVMILSSPGPLHAQKEANNWYFPNRRAITFESGKPKVIINNSMTNNEGATTISSSDGKLQIYSNGQKIWDRHGRPVPAGRGLLGGESSTTAALLIKKPGTTYFYYLVTTQDYFTDSSRLCYSILYVDPVSGNITVSNKNTILLRSSSEKVTAIDNSAADGSWVIAIDWRIGRIVSFALSDSCISDIPVISDSVYANYDDPEGRDKMGVMKASMDGKYLAVAVLHSGEVSLYDYNSNHGYADFRYTLHLDDNMHPYGLEYSLSGRYLYASCLDLENGHSKIYQYDLSLENVNDVKAKTRLVAEYSDRRIHYGLLQLGPDGKIYHPFKGDSLFGIIEHPDKLGDSCGYHTEVFPIYEGQSKDSFNSYSLPAFKQSIFNPMRFTHNNACIGTSSVLKISDLLKCDSIRWFFNDSLSPGATDTGRVVEYLFSSEGRYWVDAIAYREGTTDTITQRVTVYPQPRVHAMNDTSITRNNTVRLRCQVESGREPYLYYWSPVDRLDDPYASSPMASPDSSTVYHVVVTDLTGCVTEDSVFVDVVEEPSISCVTAGHDSVYADRHYEQFIPDPLHLSYTVTNTGTVTLTGCEASIILPSEFTLAGTDSTQSFTAPEYANEQGGPVAEGSILPSASCTRWWKIIPTQAIADTAPKQIRWQWTSDQQGTQSGCERTMYLVPDQLQSIVLTPLHLYFEAEHGGPLPSEQHVQLWTGGGLVMPWTAQPSEWWLDAQPTSGSQSTQISVQPNSTLLDAGAHGADLLFATTPTDRHVAITYVIRKSTGIESPAAPGALTLDAWPQPVAAGAWLHVRIGGEAGGSCRLTLHDLLSRERLTRYAETASPVVIDLGALQLPTGVYLLRAVSANGAQATRMIALTGGR